MHVTTTLRTTLGPRQGVNNKKNYIGSEGPSVCVQHFISVDFKGRFSVGSGGATAGGGGGALTVCAALCRAVPCRAVPCRWGGASKGLCHGGRSTPNISGHKRPYMGSWSRPS